MVTLITADLHLAEGARDAYRFLFLEKTLPTLIHKHKAMRLIVLGDLTEAKDSHRAVLVNRIVDGFVALASLVHVYVLKGNHDYVAEDVPFYRFMQHIDHMHWINEPTFLRLRGLGDCLFLPHARNPVEAWNTQPLDRVDWTFCHQTFDGARGENGQSLSGISHDIFPHNTQVVSGDVHVPQKLGSVTYVGSPTTIDFGDAFEPRVLLLNVNKIQSIPVPGPQKRLITISGRDPLVALRMATPCAKDIVKVRIELPPGSELSRAQVRADVRAWAEEAGVYLDSVQVQAPQVSAKPNAVINRARTSDADLIRAYAKKMGQGKVAIAAGLKLIEEVT